MSIVGDNIVIPCQWCGNLLEGILLNDSTVTTRLCDRCKCVTMVHLKPAGKGRDKGIMLSTFLRLPDMRGSNVH